MTHFQRCQPAAKAVRPKAPRAKPAPNWLGEMPAASARAGQ